MTHAEIVAIARAIALSNKHPEPEEYVALVLQNYTEDPATMSQPPVPTE